MGESCSLFLPSKRKFTQAVAFTHTCASATGCQAAISLQRVTCDSAPEWRQRKGKGPSHCLLPLISSQDKASFIPAPLHPLSFLGFSKTRCRPKPPQIKKKRGPRKDGTGCAWDGNEERARGGGSLGVVTLR